MTLQRWIAAIAFGCLISVSTIALLAFTSAWTPEALPRCFVDVAHSQFPKWLGCAIATHETLAGGLIAAGVALFGAWLAFIGLQDQIGLAQKNEREGRRLAHEKQVQDAAINHNLVLTALSYVNGLAEKFPPTNLGPDRQRVIFSPLLLELRRRGDLRLNENAARAPDGIGQAVTTLIGRLNTLADNLYEETKHLTADVRATELRNYEQEVVDLIEAMRRLAKTLVEQADIYAHKWMNLRDERVE